MEHERADDWGGERRKTVSENRWTPGPWEIDEQGHIWGDGMQVAHINYAEDFPCEENEADCQAMCEANARLIAAAPELFKACTMALAFIESCYESDIDEERSPEGNQLRAAIALANNFSKSTKKKGVDAQTPKPSEK